MNNAATPSFAHHNIRAECKVDRLFAYSSARGTDLIVHRLARDATLKRAHLVSLCTVMQRIQIWIHTVNTVIQ